MAGAVHLAARLNECQIADALIEPRSATEVGLGKSRSNLSVSWATLGDLWLGEFAVRASHTLPCMAFRYPCSGDVAGDVLKEFLRLIAGEHFFCAGKAQGPSLPTPARLGWQITTGPSTSLRSGRDDKVWEMQRSFPCSG